MKVILLAVLAAAPLASVAAEAYIFPPGQNQVGDVVPQDKLVYVLYTNEKCALPLVHAGDMRRAEMTAGRGKMLQGCWGKRFPETPTLLSSLTAMAT